MTWKTLDLYVLFLTWSKVNHRLRFLCSGKQIYFFFWPVQFYFTSHSYSLQYYSVHRAHCAVQCYCSWTVHLDTGTNSLTQALSPSRATCFLVWPSVSQSVQVSIVTLQDLYFIQVLLVFLISMASSVRSTISKDTIKKPFVLQEIYCVSWIRLWKRCKRNYMSKYTTTQEKPCSLSQANGKLTPSSPEDSRVLHPQNFLITQLSQHTW